MRVAAAIASTFLLLVACGGGKQITSRTQTPSGTQTAALRHPLPAGFSAGGVAAAPARLAARPAGSINVATLRRAPLPRSQIPSLAQAIVNQPVPTVVHPLLLSVQASQLHPGSSLTVVAGGFPQQPPHDALFVLLGPSYRGERLVKLQFGVAAAIIALPSSMTAGTWAVAAEDVSQLKPDLVHHKIAGDVILGLGVFTVGPA